MDRESRDLKRSWKQAERLVAKQGFPLADAELGMLFASVAAALRSRPCDHTRTVTEDWLRRRNHPLGPVLEWLDGHGGFCDCEVVANAREHFTANR